MNKKQKQPTSNPFDLDSANPVDAVAKALIVSLAWSAGDLSLERKPRQRQRRSPHSQN